MGANHADDGLFLFKQQFSLEKQTLLQIIYQNTQLLLYHDLHPSFVLHTHQYVMFSSSVKQLSNRSKNKSIIIIIIMWATKVPHHWLWASAAYDP